MENLSEIRIISQFIPPSSAVQQQHGNFEILRQVAVVDVFQHLFIHSRGCVRLVYLQCQPAPPPVPSSFPSRQPRQCNATRNSFLRLCVVSMQIAPYVPASPLRLATCTFISRSAVTACVQLYLSLFGVGVVDLHAMTVFSSSRLVIVNSSASGAAGYCSVAIGSHPCCAPPEGVNASEM